MGDILGPDGKPIVQQTPYFLGPNALTLPGSPTELFSVFQRTMAAGGSTGADLVPMILSTWAHASVAVSQCLQAAGLLDIKMMALERVLARQSNSFNAEYQVELMAIQHERRGDAEPSLVFSPPAPKEEMH